MHCRPFFDTVAQLGAKPYTPAVVAQGRQGTLAPLRDCFLNCPFLLTLLFAMAVDSQGVARSSFDLKSAQLPVLAILLRDVDVTTLIADLAQRLADDPDFFDNDPVLIDLHLVQDAPEPIDFPRLLQALRHHHTCPVAVRGGSPAQMQAAQAAGLAVGDDAVVARPPVREVEVVREVRVEVPVQVAVEAPARQALVIDKPLRSGQQVYAKGSDLVVLAMVSFGAEVIADGNVHVYAPLRGRAVAGARGNTEARIFSTCMEPQLLSIAGSYRALESDLPPNVAGKPAQARLDGDRLVIEPLT